MIALAVMALTGNFFADTFKWDFEHPSPDWVIWGLKNTVETTPERIKEIITYSQERPHLGTMCLVLRDQFTTTNLFMTQAKSVAAGQGGRYIFGGFARSNTATPLKFSAGIAVETKDGKFIRWEKLKSFDANSEWSEFRLRLETDKLPTEAYLRPAVFVNDFTNTSTTSTGEVALDDLYFSKVETTPIDLRGAANRSFSGSPDKNGICGWTGQGDQDIRKIKTGRQNLSDIVFEIINPAGNDNRSCIVLSSRDRKFPKETSAVAVNNIKTDWIYLLHAAAWAGQGTKAGTVDLIYTDGSSHRFDIICGKQVADWWSGNCSDSTTVIQRDACTKQSDVYLTVTPLANPCPEKAISKVEFKTGGDPTPIWMIVGMTFGNGINLAENRMTANRDYSQWFDFKLGIKKSNHPLVDLSALLQRPAGRHGFVKIENGHFVFADGTPARFFGTNIHSCNALFPSHEQAEAIADTLARYGINIVRLHLPESVLIDTKKTVPSRLINDQEKWDRFDYFIHALKDRGIYILLDSVTGMSTGKISVNGLGLPDPEYYKSHRASACYEPKIQEYAQQYLKDLLTHVNKYTEKRLADEPAIAMLILINEQSVFFDFGKIDPDYFKQLFTGLFNDFLKRRYNSKDKFIKAWTGTDGISALQSGEDFDQGNIRPVDVKTLTDQATRSDDTSAPSPRTNDTIRFLHEIQDRYNESMKEQLAAIGCKIPVASTNVICTPAELLSHRKMDFTSQNAYYDHVTVYDNSYGSKNIPLVKINPVYPEQTLIETLITPVKFSDKPVTTSETDVMWPHEWRSSYLPSLASIAALQDWDAVFQFAYGGGYGLTWNDMFTAKTILRPTVEYNDPAIIGTLPAAALLFHRRDVQQAKNLVQVRFGRNDLLKNVSFTKDKIQFPYNYLTFVSRIEAVYDGEVADTSIALKNPAGGKDFSIPLNIGSNVVLRTEQTTQLDQKMKKAGLLSSSFGIQSNKIISDTGELERDWDHGVLKINTPRTRGFSGFSGGRPQAFGEVVINTSLPFATVLASSLDGQDLEHSNRVLLTAVSRAENSSDRISYAKKIQKDDLIRGEDLILVRGKDGKTLTEIVKGRITVNGQSARLTPLTSDMTAAAAPCAFNGQNDKIEVIFGNENPSIWYLLEITR